MSRELSEIITDLNDSKKHLEQLEAEVTHAESFRDDANDEFEDIKCELELVDYQVFKKWVEDNT